MAPLVSVVVTTYNQAPYVEQAIQSVFAQTFNDYEVIVVDDGSTDDTPARIAPFTDSVVYIRQRNRGIAGSRNAGVRHARGQLVAFLDGDDLWEPEKLAVQVAAAQSHPESGLIITDGVHSNGNEILRPSLISGAVKHRIEQTDHRFVTLCCYAEFLAENLIYTMSQAMIPRRVLDIVGASDRQIKLASDYDLHVRIASLYPVTFIKRKLVLWRYHGLNTSGPLHLRHFRFFQDYLKIWKKQYRVASNEHKYLIRCRLKEQIKLTAEMAYYRSAELGRLWASQFLLKIWLKNLHEKPLPFFLVGLWIPQALVRVLGPIARKLMARKKTPYPTKLESL
jgi:glycosyltransferase involved in cell wall biosynthesis